MKLSHFSRLLQDNADQAFRLMLPTGHMIPASFHITEVARIEKTFIDCGGRLHESRSCLLQAWLGSDTDHSLLCGKMAGVLASANRNGVLRSGEDLDVEVEYQDAATAQYALSDYTVRDGTVEFALANKQTDCLAKDICTPRLPTISSAAPCCGATGCC
jgi:hypothetical protein